MAWRNGISLPFTRIEIVSRVPPESGVYGIFEGDSCVFVGESWNLRARLLELASVLAEVGHLGIVYELCADEQRSDRKTALTAELIGQHPDESVPIPGLPGLLSTTAANR
jgi:hypothetical protein